MDNNKLMELLEAWSVPDKYEVKIENVSQPTISHSDRNDISRFQPHNQNDKNQPLWDITQSMFEKQEDISSLAQENEIWAEDEPDPMNLMKIDFEYGGGSPQGAYVDLGQENDRGPAYVSSGGSISYH